MRKKSDERISLKKGLLICGFAFSMFFCTIWAVKKIEASAAGIVYISTANITTPNGTVVEVKIPAEGSEQTLASYRPNIDETNLTFLSDATHLFNCHSYAWYSQDVESNTYWMDDPSAYYTDGSYIECDRQEAEIICYFDDEGDNIHSGRVVDVLEGKPNNKCEDSNLVIVESKWAGGPLYRHRGDHATWYLPTEYVTQNRAVEVRYYKYNHVHATTGDWVIIDNNTHEGTCTCGTAIENHTWEYTPSSAMAHIKTCTKCGYSQSEAHVYINQVTGYRCKKCEFTSLIIPVPNPMSLSPILRMQLSTAIANGETEVLLDAGNGTAILYSNGQVYILVDENATTTQIEQAIDLICVEPIYWGGAELSVEDDDSEDE